MAIKKAITLNEYGITLDDAYHKIDFVRIENGFIEYDVNVYANELNRRARPMTPVARKTLNVKYSDLLTIDGEELFAKLYTHTKKFYPEYSTESTDV